MALINADASGFLQRSLFAGGTGAIKRVPFIFTSAYRLSKFGNLSGSTSAPTDPTLAQIQGAANGRLANQGPLAAVIAAGASQLPDNQFKVSVNGAMVRPTIAMAVNPQSVKFSQGKRLTKQDTKKGSTFFHYLDDRGSNDDILVCTFNGVSGNINAPADDVLAQNTQAGNSFKLQIWHELMNITHEPLYIPGFGKNEFHIQYTSPLFRQGVKLTGFYNQALDFDENAGAPFNKPYMFAFTVTRTDPPLWTIINAVNAALGDGATSLIKVT